MWVASAKISGVPVTLGLLICTRRKDRRTPVKLTPPKGSCRAGLVGTCRHWQRCTPLQRRHCLRPPPPQTRPRQSSRMAALHACACSCSPEPTSKTSPPSYAMLAPQTVRRFVLGLLFIAQGKNTFRPGRVQHPIRVHCLDSSRAPCRSRRPRRRRCRLRQPPAPTDPSARPSVDSCVALRTASAGRAP